jgi:hypothetical protein
LTEITASRGPDLEPEFDDAGSERATRVLVQIQYKNIDLPCAKAKSAKSEALSDESAATSKRMGAKLWRR